MKTANECASDLWLALRMIDVDIDAVDIEPALNALRMSLEAYGKQEYERGVEDALNVSIRMPEEEFDSDSYYMGVDRCVSAIRALKEKK